MDKLKVEEILNSLSDNYGNFEGDKVSNVADDIMALYEGLENKLRECKHQEDVEDDLRSHNQKLVMALEPFAKESESWIYCKDEVHLKAQNKEGSIENIPLTVKDLRRAKEALKQNGVE